MSFQFLDPGAMVDQELELVAPAAQWIEDMLAACHHPLTARDMPAEAHTTREHLEKLIASYPKGHVPADPSQDLVPAYNFWMHLSARDEHGITMAGGIRLRIGSTHNIEQYYGHIGYHVYPPARGHHYAERAARLVLPLARRHAMKSLIITCNPDNIPSRRTCERLGASLIDIVALPPDNPLFLRGERAKCRYLLRL